MNRKKATWSSHTPTARKLALAGVLLAGIWAAPAQAYRPFEGTDAAVAEPGVFELELGPVGYIRSGAGRSLVAPAIVGNYGFAGDFELVLEGKVNRALGTFTDTYRTSVGDTALSVKHVLRHGSLQDGGSGISIAAECGILLQEFHGADGTGATCAGIASQRFDLATVHLNTAFTRARDKSNSRFLGVIVEGNGDAVRPVTEVFVQRSNNGGLIQSALVGAIWKHNEELSFDMGLRRARIDGENLTELRLGLTWSLAMRK